MNATTSAPREVFILSDGTGITAQHLAHSLLSQFEHIDFHITTLPYIDSKQKALEVVDKINQVSKQCDEPPLIFATLIKQNAREIINRSKGKIYDLFHAFLAPLEKTLNTKCSYTMGRTHSVSYSTSYQLRINSLNFTLDHDDGIKVSGYKNADIVIVGVSRCGKTPTSIYLAMQFGLKVANYPLTEDDASFGELPKCLVPYKSKLFGITISSDRLHAIRQDRQPNSNYASLAQCKKEVQNVERMLAHNNIPYINSTFHSIEEISTQMLAQLGIERKSARM